MDVALKTSKKYEHREGVRTVKEDFVRCESHFNEGMFDNGVIWDSKHKDHDLETASAADWLLTVYRNGTGRVLTPR